MTESESVLNKYAQDIKERKLSPGHEAYRLVAENIWREELSQISMVILNYLDLGMPEVLGTGQDWQNFEEAVKGLESEIQLKAEDDIKVKQVFERARKYFQGISE